MILSVYDAEAVTQENKVIKTKFLIFESVAPQRFQKLSPGFC